MYYVIFTRDNKNRKKYVLTSRVALFCPELAARFEDKKIADTIAENYLKNKDYDNLTVTELTFDIINEAHRKYGDALDI